jgi:hypothetical protein
VLDECAETDHFDSERVLPRRSHTVVGFGFDGGRSSVSSPSVAESVAQGESEEEQGLPMGMYLNGMCCDDEVIPEEDILPSASVLPRRQSRNRSRGRPAPAAPPSASSIPRLGSVHVVAGMGMALGPSKAFGSSLSLSSLDSGITNTSLAGSTNTSVGGGKSSVAPIAASILNSAGSSVDPKFLSDDGTDDDDDIDDFEFETAAVTPISARASTVRMKADGLATADHLNGASSADDFDELDTSEAFYIA